MKGQVGSATGDIQSYTSPQENKGENSKQISSKQMLSNEPDKTKGTKLQEHKIDYSQEPDLANPISLRPTDTPIPDSVSEVPSTPRDIQVAPSGRTIDRGATLPSRYTFEIPDLTGLSLTNDKSIIYQAINKHILSQPYHEEKSRQITLNETIVYRPNHNGTHGSRTVQYLDQIWRLIIEKGSPESKKVLEQISSKREELKLAAYMMRSGRVNEAPLKVDNYYDRSALLFKACADQLDITPENVDWAAQMIQESARNPERNFSRRLEDIFTRSLLSIAHECDLVRCYDERNMKREMGLIKTLLSPLLDRGIDTEATIAKLINYGIELCALTGNKLTYPEFIEYQHHFIQCSENHDFCESKLAKAKPPIW